MKAILNLSFDDAKGRNCEHCMLSEIHYPSSRDPIRYKCTAYGSRPFCPEEGCRKDCPLIVVEDSKSI